MTEDFDLAEISSHFDTGGEFVSAKRFGGGHINDTFVVRVSGNSEKPLYTLQRIDNQVFTDPIGVMENISRVTEHLKAKRVNCLTLIPTVDRDNLYRTPQGDYWRMYEFISGATTYDRVLSVDQARLTGAKFGEFQGLLTDLPGPRLNETIPDFHNTPVRYAKFHEAVAEDASDRVRTCDAEIDQALAWEKEAGTLVSLYGAGQVPERIIHNDTKLNNLLFDAFSGETICVIDLDTVMPGISLYDFGDMVRTATSPTNEDTIDVASIGLHLPFYEALVDGFVSASADFLTTCEVEHLAVSGKIITIEIGLRFLTDYLQGDQYFGADRPTHNLDRCRAQFALAASIEDQFDEMRNITSRVTANHHFASPESARIKPI